MYKIPGFEVIKFFKAQTLRSQEFNWSGPATECTLTNENPEILNRIQNSNFDTCCGCQINNFHVKT
jgi:hypothetical protein